MDNGVWTEWGLKLISGMYVSNSLGIVDLCIRVRVCLEEEYPNCYDCENYESTCRICRARWMTLDDIPGDNLKVPVVEMRDFVFALKNLPASVSKREISMYERWTKTKS